MQLIIGLCGKAGSGKDTIAQIIKEYCQQREISCDTIHFAKALKDIATNIFGWDGQKDERGRRLLQVIGTDCARAYNENFWIQKWEEGVSKTNSRIILVPDVRFVNESRAIHNKSGLMIQVKGRAYDLGNNSSHPSEAGLPEDEVDHFIINDNTIEALTTKVQITIGIIFSTFLFSR